MWETPVQSNSLLNGASDKREGKKVNRFYFISFCDRFHLWLLENRCELQNLPGRVENSGGWSLECSRQQADRCGEQTTGRDRRAFKNRLRSQIRSERPRQKSASAEENKPYKQFTFTPQIRLKLQTNFNNLQIIKTKLIWKRLVRYFLQSIEDAEQNRMGRSLKDSDVCCRSNHWNALVC